MFWTLGDRDWFNTEAEALKAQADLLAETGYFIPVECYTEAQAYGTPE